MGKRFTDEEVGKADLNHKPPCDGNRRVHQQRVEEMIRGNRRIKPHEIDSELGISNNSILRLFSKFLA